MSGVVGSLNSPPPEARKRSPASIEEIYNGGFQRGRNRGGGSEKHVRKCRFSFPKLILGAITFFTFLTFIYSHRAHRSHGFFTPTSRWAGSIQGDIRYMAEVEVDWAELYSVLEGSGCTRVGLMNFGEREAERWREAVPGAEQVTLNLEPVSEKVVWETLYPEWIDEEEEGEVPICPSLPSVKFPPSHLDLIAVKLPCRDAPDWARDVPRLHLQIAAARLAVSLKNASGGRRLRILIISPCLPIPNLFTCKDVASEGRNFWLYEPDVPRLRERLLLPIGSCQLSLPVDPSPQQHMAEAGVREAYVTILHSTNFYVCGAIVAAHSIRMTGSTRDLILLVDDLVTAENRRGLEAAGWSIRRIERIRNPNAEPGAYNEWNYSKLRLWQLTDYSKLVFVDADLLLLRRLDGLFRLPEIAAVGNNASLFNSGVMVVEPAECTFRLLTASLDRVRSYNGGDQGYLNEIFTWWHRIPKTMNFLKHSWPGDGPSETLKKARFFTVDPPALYVIHYLGLKPWLCFRDFDCNWNVDILREFASDEAHSRWWRVHDAMPGPLQRFCLLRSKQKAALEWDRRLAEAANFSDRHWSAPVTDPRINICIDPFCDWEQMLEHWGETVAIAPPPLPVAVGP